MRKLLLASFAAVTLMVGAGLTQPAHAQAYCWSGPLGILHGCGYGPGPAWGYPAYAPPPYPYYGNPYYAPYYGY
jgi:hypothetical protein